MIKENISTIFLLPSIGISEDIKDEFYDNGFINTYISLNKVTYPYNIIILGFKPDNFNLYYSIFESKLINNPNFIEIFDIGSNYVLYTFKIPNKFTNDFTTFLEGKYSEFSDEYKSLFPINSYLYDKNGRIVLGLDKKPIVEVSTFHQIFNKSGLMREGLAKKFGYEVDDPFLDEIEFYEKYYPDKELFTTNTNI